MLMLLVPIGVATLVGLVLLWPGSGPSPAQRAADSFFPPGTTYPTATVLDLTTFDCSTSVGEEPLLCATALVQISTGVSAGDDVNVELTADIVSSGIEPGDGLVLSRDPGTTTGQVSYAFQDYERNAPIILLTVVFALVVGLVARWRGLKSLIGLVFAFLVLGVFVLPALLAGESPILVSLVGSSAIMFVALYLAHGFSARTTTALLGTLFGLALVAVLGALAVATARLTGLTSEETVQLQTYDPTLSFSGLVLAGIVVAGLGVLNDVTITQAASVWQLHEVSPELSSRQLFARGMQIGRDHIASTVYTIAFAYAGTTLPLLLLFEIYQRPFWTTLTSSQVAEPLLSALVGSIALVLATPVTTAVGAFFAKAADGSAPAPPRPPSPDAPRPARRSAVGDAYRDPTRTPTTRRSDL
ncbi:YibE/F family protein [Modestobacter sp. I12A-02628]|uniref:YibE/F family protein n=2 Tax=Goekera deserti TaxID=2497753 RepID=A0A7K3WL15_9ACTN|nr:YibE/F family protein [Goekera deserti]NDI46976.1 YibE/F family protein [Goekera deserti]NEL56213.1 YibE/F family protein [Goekera deserti]